MRSLGCCCLLVVVRVGFTAPHFYSIAQPISGYFFFVYSLPVFPTHFEFRKGGSGKNGEK